MSLITCPHCGQKVSSSRTTCHKCGGILKRIVCPECGYETDDGSSECPECGFVFVEKRDPVFPVENFMDFVYACKRLGDEDNFVDIYFMKPYVVDQETKCWKLGYEGGETWRNGSPENQCWDNLDTSEIKVRVFVFAQSRAKRVCTLTVHSWFEDSDELEIYSLKYHAGDIVFKEEHRLETFELKEFEIKKDIPSFEFRFFASGYWKDEFRDRVHKWIFECDWDEKHSVELDFRTGSLD